MDAVCYSNANFPMKKVMMNACGKFTMVAMNFDAKLQTYITR